MTVEEKTKELDSWCNKHGLKYHPRGIDSLIIRIVEIGGRCPCAKERQHCPCDESIEECKRRGMCKCRLFVNSKAIFFKDHLISATGGPRNLCEKHTE